MSNVENTGSGNTNADLEAQVAELRAQLGRLNAGGNAGGTNAATAAAVNATASSGAGVVREPGEGATVIGAAPDPRGGTALAYSDGTIRLVGVPAGTDGNLATPWGSAPEGEYSQFYTDDNGNRYNFVRSDGTAVESVDNPNQTRP